MSVTLANLRTYVRQQADQENSTFISDSELNRYINQSAAELRGLLATTYDDYHLTSTTFTLSSANTYALPSDFFKLRGLDYQHGSDWITVPRFNFEERNRWQNRYERGELDAWRTYRVQGSVIYVMPDDNYAGSYRIWYTSTFSALTQDASTLDDTMGWDEYVVVDAAIKCLQKEESDASLLMARKAELKRRIEAEAANRDASGPERMHVAVGLDDFGYDIDTWGR